MEHDPAIAHAWEAQTALPDCAGLFTVAKVKLGFVPFDEATFLRQ